MYENEKALNRQKVRNVRQTIFFDMDTWKHYDALAVANHTSISNMINRDLNDLNQLEHEVQKWKNIANSYMDIQRELEYKLKNILKKQGKKPEEIDEILLKNEESNIEGMK